MRVRAFSLMLICVPALAWGQIDPKDELPPDGGHPRPPHDAGTPDAKPADKAPDEKPAVVADKPVDTKSEGKGDKDKKEKPKAKPKGKLAVEDKKSKPVEAQAKQVDPSDVGHLASEDAPKCENEPDCLEARAAFIRAEDLFEKNKFAAALEEFQKGYRSKPLSAFEFNIAKVNQRLSRFGEAVTWYNRFLAHSESTRDRADATRYRTLCEDAIRETEQEAQKKAAVAITTVPSPHNASSSAIVAPTLAPKSSSGEGAQAWFRTYWGPFALGIGAAALLGTGIGLHTAGSADFDRFAKTCAPACNPADIERPQTRYSAGIALMVFGSVAAAADAILWGVTVSRNKSDKQALRLVPMGMGVMASGRF